MGNRRQARECALQMLYQLDMSRGETDEVVARFWQTNEADTDVRAFADELVRGVVKNMGELDDLLSSHSTNWKISRMAAVDKNVLRLAAYELTSRPDIPVKVTINEAVEIAKRFGTAESGAFVNGILDNIAGKVKKDQPGEAK
ncbi:MAG TPA: transcription antitermination factor NusB [bacterium]|nr:transcription antitermination factor NusB [bacterium]